MILPASPNSPPLLLTVNSLSSRDQKSIFKLVRASKPVWSMEQQEDIINMRGAKLMEFPHLLSSHKHVMVDLVSSIDKHLHSHLLPSPLTVPPDVEFYRSSTATASEGTLSINRGIGSSPIDFILASWLHLKLPNGGAMNITNLQGYLKPTTLVPHFQFELVECNPTYFILFIDLIPRKDLVLHQDYLKKFYEDTPLKTYRQKLHSQVAEMKPYFASSLHFRGVVSPTAVLVGIKFEDGQAERVEEVIRECINPVANEVLKIWIDMIVGEGKGMNVVGEIEREELKKRDGVIKARAVEIDLSATLPLQFGQDVADRVLSVIKGACGI